MLDSTLWTDIPLRNVFITALLMAEPREFTESVKQYRVDAIELTGWEAPPGWYGFVPSAGIGILYRAKVDRAIGMECLRMLGEPEAESRSSDFDGRRMIRCDGGYVILNYQKFRDHDYAAAERMRRYRERKKARNAVTVRRNVTQAEVEVEVSSLQSSQDHLFSSKDEKKQEATVASLPVWLPRQEWAEFCEMRKKFRNVPFTEAAKGKTLDALWKLHEKGQDLRQVLAQSVQRGWRGVFEVNSGGNNSGTHQGHRQQGGAVAPQPGKQYREPSRIANS